MNRGRYNFDVVKIDAFRDEAVMREAHKADVIDVRNETISKAWASEYDFPAVRKGLFKRELVKRQIRKRIKSGDWVEAAAK